MSYSIVDLATRNLQKSSVKTTPRAGARRQELYPKMACVYDPSKGSIGAGDEIDRIGGRDQVYTP